MIFGRRGEKRSPLLSYERILVPLAGTEADDGPLRLAAVLLADGGGQVSLLHVIEVPFERQLDAEDPEAIAFADEVIERAEAFLAERELPVRTGIAQARAAGAAIVDDAVEQNSDLILMGLRYKKRFGGGWDAGRTVPYVMRNSTAPVWCLRVETEDLAHTP
ncbi:MAG TPA: universal stress protein [Candidatus Limnocylindria bacterium]|jgi:nucleotide-binding universal stress UspA family protein|nr:universal stress protein [Candidatus Limnocylindria bacterium]